MKYFAKFVAPLAIVLALGLSQTAPAQAQGNLAGVFGGGGGSDDDMMTKMEPMLEMLKKKMGKKRFTQLMQTVGPMFDGSSGGGGFGGFGGGGFDFNNIGHSFGGYGGGFGGGGFDMNAVSGLMSSGALQQMVSLGGRGGRKGKRSKRH